MQQEKYFSLEKQFRKFLLPSWHPTVGKNHKNLIVEGAGPREKISHDEGIRSVRKYSADTEEKILKKDKRVLDNNTTAFPTSSHVFLKMDFGEVGVGYGSGQMIGPYHVLTCAHNIYDVKSGKWADQIIVCPGANGEGNSPFGEIAAVKAIILQDWTQGDEEADIGLILLEEEVGYETGWASFASWQDKEFNGIDLRVSGYPGDKSFGTLYGMSGRISKAAKSILYYKISTAPGQSGGPIWREGSFPVVLGVHCRGGPEGMEWNEGTRISEKYFYWILLCMDMTHTAFTCKENNQGLTKCRIETLDYKKVSTLISMKSIDGTRYIGQYKKINDYEIKEGYGLLIQTNGKRYKGHFLNDQKHGLGVCIYTDGSKYEGRWSSGIKEGQGKLIWPDKSFYKGSFYNNKRHGDVGVYESCNGSRYIGKWKNDKKDGYGSLTYPDGSDYRGVFYQDERHGQGTYRYTDGRVYEGQWRHDRKEGRGKLTQTVGNTETYSYEGDFYDDLKHGKGTEKFKDGSMYIGQWKNGQKEGPGKFIGSDGIHSEELFLDGKNCDQDDSPFSGNKVFNGQEKMNDQACQEQDERHKDKPMKKPLKKSRSFKVDPEDLSQINFFIDDITGGNDAGGPSQVRSTRDKAL